MSPASAVTVPSFAALAGLLHRNLYRPFPTVGKAPAIFGWNELNKGPWDDAALQDAIAEFSDESYGVGLAVPASNVAVDIDVLDAEKAAIISALQDDMLGRTPLLRIGQAPKQIGLFRCEDPKVRSRKLHPVEIFCGSGYFVGFGIHEKTGRPYEWIRGESPRTLRADDPAIPLIDQATLDRFLTEVFKVIPRAAVTRTSRRVRTGHSGAVPSDLHSQLRLHARAVGFPRAARQMLETCSEGDRHMSMYAVVCAAVGRGWGDGRIWDLLEKHFAGWDGVKKAAVERALSDCRATGDAVRQNPSITVRLPGRR